MTLGFFVLAHHVGADFKDPSRVCRKQTANVGSIERSQQKQNKENQTDLKKKKKKS